MHASAVADAGLSPHVEPAQKAHGGPRVRFLPKVWTPDPSFYRPAASVSWLLLRFDWFEEQAESEAWR